MAADYDLMKDSSPCDFSLISNPTIRFAKDKRPPLKAVDKPQARVPEAAPAVKADSAASTTKSAPAIKMVEKKAVCHRSLYSASAVLISVRIVR